MRRVEGALARTLDFGEGRPSAGPVASGRPMLRVALRSAVRGANKYKVLDARRRHAQIRARRLLDLMESKENGR
jgi:hypothetical protein